MLGRFRIKGVSIGPPSHPESVFAWVAQSVEQRTRNAQVRSSNLLSGSSSPGLGAVICRAEQLDEDGRAGWRGTATWRSPADEIRVEPDRPTTTVQFGPVKRHVGSMDDGVDFHIRWLGNRDPNAAADDDRGVTNRGNLARGLPDDSVGKLGEAVRIVLPEPSDNELISPQSRNDV